MKKLRRLQSGSKSGAGDPTSTRACLSSRGKSHGVIIVKKKNKKKTQRKEDVQTIPDVETGASSPAPANCKGTARGGVEGGRDGNHITSKGNTKLEKNGVQENRQVSRTLNKSKIKKKGLGAELSHLEGPTTTMKNEVWEILGPGAARGIITEGSGACKLEGGIMGKAEKKRWRDPCQYRGKSFERVYIGGG